ncbi:SDR family NAD(P)-dependent oxidoreductase [Algiphilus sp.]|uniref:SDR family NAD(P)-dependent oxidoreductase n=1 Tax=Algiphilus sp. TaxID=1872431 RepID=UPI001CA6E041|nr:SDR family NAD(P)-dependent oxidoreductase [Algiphilus sp.]MBY8965666.1 SDR family NAD(P)-dependent oxidoreductase [Algiphilus acroporae]MCI5105053.1 SDR family NAD(P)-dependent oxidoreductase [Algiphilus sp.]MCR9091313.1 SDR family NAD(P)-dependent oxidoreductase [Pseudomonadota bacterium]
MLNRFHNKICVITGGSSGIGYSVAEALARDGARLLLVARQQALLEQAATRLRALGAAEVRICSADVTKTDQLAGIAQAVSEMGEAADLIVTSAGVVSAGLFEDVPLEEWRRLHEVNVIGLVAVLQTLLPAMRARAKAGGGGGHIVNIASAAGLVGFPGMAAYGATKAAVTGLSESLRAELSGLGIGVTAVCPGFVQTPIADKITLFGRMDTPRTRKMIGQWFQRNDLSPERVAAATLAAVRRDRALVVVGKDASSGYWTKRFAPGILRMVLRRAGGASATT